MGIGVHTAAGRRAVEVFVVLESKTEHGPVQVQNLQMAGQTVQVVRLKCACVNWGNVHNHVARVRKEAYESISKILLECDTKLFFRFS